MSGRDSKWMQWRTLAVRPEMRPVWLVACLSIIATLLFSGIARRETHAAAELAFDALTQKFVAELKRNMTAYEQVLRAGVGLLNTRLAITEDDWNAFVGALDLAKRYPGSRGVGYAEMIDRQSVPHEATARPVLGRENGTADAQSPAPTAIVLLASQDLNDQTLREDMFSEPARRAAMIRARDSGLVAATSKVVLGKGDSATAGVIIYAPVYRVNEVPETLEQRKSALVGYVFSPLSIGEFVGSLTRSAVADLPELMHVELFDADHPEAQDLLYDNLPADGAPVRAGRFQTVTPCEQNGRSWSLRFTSLPKFEAGATSEAGWAMLAIGSVLSLLVTAFAGSQALRHIDEAEANAHMALLTRELSHRVKNTLAIVQSIANRSLADGRSIAEGREVFRNRLHALARAHTFLIDNAWSGADLKDLVAGELAAFEGRATVKGPEVRLKPQIAQTFALVVHELATNAVRHGSLSVENGRIGVAWSIVDRDGVRTLRFRWREMGGPPVRAPTRAGFGQTLLRQVLAHGATREPAIEFSPTGFRYSFDAPLADIADISDAAGHESDESVA